MQRLFSTFPNAWPGLGLLILRLAACVSLAAAAHVSAGAAAGHLVERCAIDSVMVLLAIGLWTPMAAVAETAIQLVVLRFAQHVDPSQLVAVALGLALAMLGPGAWSLDARLFGRKRLV